MELLAPAGDMQSLIAAVQNGADAVYLGLTSLSARANAKNFTFDQLKEALEYNKSRQVLTYLTLNTLIDQHVIGLAMENAYKAYMAGIDGIIVQDLGLAKEIKNNIPTLPLHASTQMSILSPKDIEVAKDLGFSRVIAAREANKEVLEDLVKTHMDIEIFAHGALCVSYSGQCYLSYFNGGKSGNKGTCAQPCRLLYDLMEEDKSLGQKSYLSTKDVCLVDHVEDLRKIGIKSLKIEGRMKSPQYVATVTRAYRNALDGQKDESYMKDLLMSFNREGFSKSYVYEKPGKNMMAYEFSSNTGMEIGKVLSVDKKKKRVTISSNTPLVNGDGISFISSQEGCYVDILKERYMQYDLVYAGRQIQVGEAVYLTFDKELNDRANRSMNDPNSRKNKVFATFSAKENQLSKLKVYDEKGRSFVATSDIEGVLAKKDHANQDILKNLNKTGNSLFEFEDIKMDIEGQIFFPTSSINKLRRDALEGLLEIYKNTGIKKSIDSDVFGSNEKNEEKDFRQFYRSINISKDLKIEKEPKVTLFFFQDRPDIDIEKLDAHRYYMPHDMYLKHKDNPKAYLHLPFGHDLDSSSFKAQNPEFKTISSEDRIISSSLGVLGMNNTKVADFGINCINTYTGDFLKTIPNLEAICLSYELKKDNLDVFSSFSWDKDLEYMAYGRIPVMKSKYCVKGAFYPQPLCCDKDMKLKDRRSKDLDLVSYCDTCTSYILGPFRINNIREKDLLRQAGANSLRINIYKEDKDEIIELIKSFT